MALTKKPTPPRRPAASTNHQTQQERLNPPAKLIGKPAKPKTN